MLNALPSEQFGTQDCPSNSKNDPVQHSNYPTPTGCRQQPTGQQLVPDPTHPTRPLERDCLKTLTCSGCSFRVSHSRAEPFFPPVPLTIAAPAASLYKIMGAATGSTRPSAKQAAAATTTPGCHPLYMAGKRQSSPTHQEGDHRSPSSPSRHPLPEPELACTHPPRH